MKKENIAFSVKAPDSIKKAIVLVIASEKSSTFSPILIDDSSGKFPFGHSLLVNATSAEIGLKAGEQEKLATPGALVSIPPVKKLNDYNQANVSFAYRTEKNDSKWILISQKALNFNSDRRRIWVAHATRGNTQPSIATIVDSR